MFVVIARLGNEAIPCVPYYRNISDATRRAEEEAELGYHVAIIAEKYLGVIDITELCDDTTYID